MTAVMYFIGYDFKEACIFLLGGLLFGIFMLWFTNRSDTSKDNA